jgi:cephalosporin hydroxylase
VTERTPHPNLEAWYQAAIKPPTDMTKPPADIWEHLPRLRELASKCEHVTEFGMREAGGSTLAILAAQPKTFISWDINPWSIVSQRVSDLLYVAGRTKFEPRVGDTLKIAPIEPTDMLFIDSLHTAKQLKAELERHADPIRLAIRKYIVFHDTVTFGFQGEDGSVPGLRAAIRWFQMEHSFPLWQLVEDRENCNGLVVLERMDVRD